MENNRKGAFVISLDFEMAWGGVGVWDKSEYMRSNVANVREVITALLDLLREYDIKATFATVGLLMLKDKSEALREYPDLTPTYVNRSLSPYENNYINILSEEKFYFASDIIYLLKSYDNIEIGTHTFSHYYCWEKGQNIKQFEADIKKAVDVAKARGIKLESIVFPKNQVSQEYLSVCCKYGIKSYRGNARSFYSRSRTRLGKMIRRVCRFIDTYVNIGGCTSYPLPERINLGHAFIQNVPASRFLRPYSNGLSFLETLKLNRIKREIMYAARHGEIYHLWWHPHNMGNSIHRNIAFLEQVFKYYAYCRKEYGMTSVLMKDVGSI